ncbi:MAG: hypothetical protein JWL82_600, partial [Parcubacteria group bacterium]|nr:hypothetical protein [Parcubacteria group bacterium]
MEIPKILEMMVTISAKRRSPVRLFISSFYPMVEGLILRTEECLYRTVVFFGFIPEWEMSAVFEDFALCIW